MEIDVNLHKPTASNGLELKTISAGIGYNTSTATNSVNGVGLGVGVGVGVGHNNLHSHLHNNNNNNNNNSSHNHRAQNEAQHGEQNAEEDEDNEEIDNRLRCIAAVTSQTTNNPPTGCCGILSRLLCSSSHTRGKTATSSGDYNTYNNCGPIVHHSSLANGSACAGGNAVATTSANYEHQQTYMNLWKKNQKTHRRTPQEIYFESRGKSCKKLLKFNGNSNKV
ncbi:hypothetical protein DOY81_001670, partial [Sarcophaga bullata]